jgi:hypothetical protein
MAIGNVARPPFQFEIHQGHNFLEVHLSGYLDAEGSVHYLKELGARVKKAKITPQDRIGLLYYDGLSGFETGRVARIHGEWFNEMRPHVTRVAIITQRMAVTMALSVAKLISKTPLSQFKDERDARNWLAQAT